jgi:hypothetical protein
VWIWVCFMYTIQGILMVIFVKIFRCSYATVQFELVFPGTTCDHCIHWSQEIPTQIRYWTQRTCITWDTGFHRWVKLNKIGLHSEKYTTCFHFGQILLTALQKKRQGKNSRLNNCLFFRSICWNAPFGLGHGNHYITRGTGQTWHGFDPGLWES